MRRFRLRQRRNQFITLPGLGLATCYSWKHEHPGCPEAWAARVSPRLAAPFRKLLMARLCGGVSWDHKTSKQGKGSGAVVSASRVCPSCSGSVGADRLNWALALALMPERRQSSWDWTVTKPQVLRPGLAGLLPSTPSMESSPFRQRF